MAGAFISEGKMLPVMFVRHGQSTNNPIYEGLYAQQFAGEITAVRNDTYSARKSIYFIIIEEKVGEVSSQGPQLFNVR